MRDGMMVVALKGKGSNGPPPQLGMPGMSKMGAPAAAAAPKPKVAPEPEAPETDESRAVPPEAVSFRTAGQSCGGCEYKQADGTCSWLKFAVEDADSCNLFEAKTEEREQPDEGEPEQGREMVAA